MAKKKKFVLENILVEDYAAEGKCVSRHNDKVIFIEGAIPGDRATIFVHKNKKDWAEAKVNSITEPSPLRIEPFCTHFGTCGGCKWQMLPYALQLQYKDKQVSEQLRRIGKIIPQQVLPILGCETNSYYRNKLEFTFSNKQYLTTDQLNAGEPFHKNVLGFHAPSFFDKVIDIETCHLQVEPTNAIKNFIRAYAYQHELSFYDIRNHQGLLRNLMIRLSSLGEVMVNLVFGEHNQQAIIALLEALVNQFPDIKSLNYIINLKLNDTIYDQEVISFYGEPYIEEHLESFRFKISPKSFFQTNTKQAERLYQVVRDFIDAKGHETLYDLYCGTGSIGIFLSKEVKTIIGVETVPDAIEDAKKNATLNALTNSYFYAGDVITICTPAFFETHGTPDIIVIDPPRAGCHEKLINTLLLLKAPTLVYVSCNPATQARDLNLLQEKYDVTRSQAVDMFPHTHHVENVVQLKLKITQ
ncbi:MAG: 23S rRNA (uracil(1939)-C(5))-methyltransferase RlmD [Chitinophagaceae bacterium]|nr:23S rRNA (uracil(1939)-C(5))-methyltransferase RlmD [Chitinophagaceae bacterium]